MFVRSHNVPKVPTSFRSPFARLLWRFECVRDSIYENYEVDFFFFFLGGTSSKERGFIALSF